MDASEVKAIVDRNIERAMGELGVPHWRVSVDYEAIETPNWSAQCDRRGRDYWEASITLDPSRFDNARAVVRAMYHELAHLILAPMDVYRDITSAHIVNDTAEAHQERVLWTHAIEGCVTALERGMLADFISATVKREKKVKRA